jgi:hypothetical protein
MSEEILPELPKELGRYVHRPYGGLFGDSAQIKIIEEIVADPYSEYRPKDFEEIIGASAPTIRRVLSDLTTLDLLIKDSSDVQHPVYRPNLESQKIIALTFLAYAMTDDRDDSDFMNSAILDYYIRVLRPRCEVLAAATASQLRYEGKSWVEGSLYKATARATGDEEFTTITKGV